MTEKDDYRQLQMTEMTTTHNKNKKRQYMTKTRQKLSVYSVISLSLLRTKKTHTGAVKLVLIRIAEQ